MGRRIEVELTSTRDDGSWTWRAAGARQPKGELVGSLLYDGAKVGDVVKVEAEFHVDGIEVTEVFAPKQKKERSNLLEMKSRQFRDDELVTTQRVSRDERRGGNRRNRRGERDDRRRGRGEGRGDRAPRPEVEARPKPKRLRPRRTHRDALLAEVGEEHRPIVEQVIKDGMPGVRAAIERQNAEAKEAGKPEIDAAPILAIAEKNVNKARLAEWRDRADAALADAAELDLRDLRSVVVSGNDIARDEASRELAEQLKRALDERVESDHANWLADMESAINDGRVVRALRLSSRPVKAGAPLPPELATTLAGQASEALAADVGQERWATVLDALAYSPVRGAVTPAGLPTEPKGDLLDAVKRLSDRIPTIAALFGIDPAAVPRSAKRRRPRREGGGKGKGSGPRRDGGAGGKQQGGDAPSAAAATTTTDRPAPGADQVPASEDASAAPSGEQAPAATADEAPETPTAPAPEAAAEEAPAPDANADEPPAEEAPAPEANADEPPAEEAPAPEAPAAESEAPEEAPVTEASVDSGQEPLTT
ncbi:MAG: hypothetical protein AAGK32_00335 [Actinomycetota bacterium]